MYKNKKPNVSLAQQKQNNETNNLNQLAAAKKAAKEKTAAKKADDKIYNQNINRINESELLPAIANISNQDYYSYDLITEKQEFKKISAGEKIFLPELLSVKRLFSNIEYSNVLDKYVSVEKAEHFIDINKIAVTNESLIVESGVKNFSKIVTINDKPVTIDINLIQTMHYNTQSQTIRFNLKDANPNPKYNYISEYKIEGNKIIFTPYTTNPAKIIKPIFNEIIIKKRLNNDTNFNLFKFLNENETKLDPVTINSTLSELQTKMNSISPSFSELQKKGAKTDSEQLKYNTLYNINSILNDSDKLNDHISQLTKWKNDYDEWVYNKDKVVQIEQHYYKFEKKQFGQGYISNKNAYILGKFRKYDLRIQLKDIKNKVIGEKLEEQSITQQQNKRVNENEEYSTIYHNAAIDLKIPINPEKMGVIEEIRAMIAAENKINEPSKNQSKNQSKNSSNKIKNLNDSDLNCSSLVTKTNILSQRIVEVFKETEQNKITVENLGQFGVNCPYLVSYILRDKPIWNKLKLSTDILGISELNIEDFTKFIHEFKSASLSLVSLFSQLRNFRNSPEGSSTNKPKLFIRFPFKPIYSGSRELTNVVNSQNNSLIEHIIMFQTMKSLNKALLILMNKPDQEQIITDLNFLELDEPLYDKELNSRVDDFDVIFSNPLNIVTLSSNLLKFNEEHGREEIEINEYTKVFDIDKCDFPALPSKPIKTSDLPSKSTQTTSVMQISASTNPIKTSDLPSKSTQTKSVMQISASTNPIKTPAQNNKKANQTNQTKYTVEYEDDDKKDGFKNKYLKYKEKYLKLKNLYNR